MNNPPFIIRLVNSNDFYLAQSKYTGIYSSLYECFVRHIRRSIKHIATFPVFSLKCVLFVALILFLHQTNAQFIRVFRKCFNLFCGGLTFLYLRFAKSTEQLLQICVVDRKELMRTEPESIAIKSRKL